jgi:hypothetical protein
VRDLSCRPLLIAIVAIAVACGGSADRDDTGADSRDAGGGAAWPRISEDACQGESCTSTYTAVPCRELPLVAGPRNPAIVAALTRLDTVEVRTDLHLEKPGVVVIRRDVSVPDDWNSGTKQAPPLRFATGDTLFLLRYIGEGFWRGWYKGRELEVAEFWGGPQPLRSAEDSARAADAMGTWPEIRTWLRISRGGQVVGWWQDTSQTRTLRPIGAYGEQLGFTCP